MPFYMEGPGGLIEFVRKRLRQNGHMVIVVAEGAGQELMAESTGDIHKLKDASGNKLLLDVGLWLSNTLKVIVIVLLVIQIVRNEIIVNSTSWVPAPTLQNKA